MVSEPGPSWTWTIVFVIAAVLLVLVVLSNSDMKPVEAKPVVAKPETHYDRCVRLGGIPITSAWNGSLTNCIFPPKE